MSKIKGLKKGKSKLSTVSMVIAAYIVLFVVLSILSPYFLTVNNLLNIGQYAAITGIASTGMTFAIIAGGLDLSVGSIMGFVGMAVATTIPASGGVLTMTLLGIVLGGVCGALNGLAITKAKINAFIATLATMSIYRGFAFIWTNGVSQSISNKDFGILGRGYIGIVPVSVVIMILVFAAAGFVLKYTKFGRKVYAIGGNPQASFLSGINIQKTTFIIYLVNGMLAGLSGVMLASQTGAGLPAAGEGYEMSVISGVILGGTSLSGGRGSILGTLFGILILVTLQNGMNILRISSYWQMVAKGIVLMLAIIMDVIRIERQGK